MSVIGGEESLTLRSSYQGWVAAKGEAVGRTDSEKIEAGIQAALELDDQAGGGLIGRLVRIYLGLEPDTYPGFAGRFFASLGDNPHDKFVPEDLLALSLLDVPPPHDAVSKILILETHDYSRLLTAIQSDIDLWDASDEDLETCTELWEKLKTIDNFGWVRAHKLLARKRPRLHPVYDNVVKTWFHKPNGIRYGLRDVLADDALRHELERRLTPSEFQHLPLVRILDIAVWMLGSRQASEARHAIGIEPPPDRMRTG